MLEYQRLITSDGKKTYLRGTRCERCGYTQLDDDEEIWSAVGL